MTQENQTEQTTEVVAPKLTRREKLIVRFNKEKAAFEKLQASLKEVVAEITAIDSLQNVEVGTAVIISTGKGETFKEVEGIVIGVKEDDEGAKQYKVSYGSGFDADVKIVKASGLKVKPAAAVEQAAE